MSLQHPYVSSVNPGPALSRKNRRGFRAWSLFRLACKQSEHGDKGTHCSNQIATTSYSVDSMKNKTLEPCEEVNGPNGQLHIIRPESLDTLSTTCECLSTAEDDFVMSTSPTDLLSAYWPRPDEMSCDSLSSKSVEDVNYDEPSQLEEDHCFISIELDIQMNRIDCMSDVSEASTDDSFNEYALTDVHQLSRVWRQPENDRSGTHLPTSDEI